MKNAFFVAALFVFASATPPVATAAGATDSAPPARAWVIKLDDRITSARAADKALPPASLTKIMTALIWLQRPARQDETVTISRRAAAETGTRAGLKAGARYRGSDLLALMLITSANDACLALAEHASGSVETFVVDMNRAAAALVLKETRFANPCGHDAPGHTSSARDLLRLTEIALADPVFRQLVATTSWKLRTVGGAEEKNFPSSNALLGRLDGARGVKTGYTAKAGKCVIALVERDGHRLLLVLLDARDRWWAAHGLVERTFERVAR